MMVPWRALISRHPVTAQCAKVEERKKRRLEEAELREISKRALEAYGEPLDMVTAF